MDFLTDSRQQVKLGKRFTDNCTSRHQSVKLLEFADDITLIGLISEEDESRLQVGD